MSPTRRRARAPPRREVSKAVSKYAYCPAPDAAGSTRTKRPACRSACREAPARLKLSQDPFPRWWHRHEIGYRARTQTLTQKGGGLCSPSPIALIERAAMTPLDRLGLEKGHEIGATEATSILMVAIGGHKYGSHELAPEPSRRDQPDCPRRPSGKRPRRPRGNRRRAPILEFAYCGRSTEASPPASYRKDCA